MTLKYLLAIIERLNKIEALIANLISGKPEEQLLDSHDMLKMLNIGDSTLRRLRREGTIPCNKIGRKYYYPKSMFTQEFLNSIIKLEDPSKKFDDK